MYFTYLLILKIQVNGKGGLFDVKFRQSISMLMDRWPLKWLKFHYLSPATIATTTDSDSAVTTAYPTRHEQMNTLQVEFKTERSQNAQLTAHSSQLQQRMASLETKLNMLRISSPPFACARAPTYGRHTKNDTFGTRVGKCPFHDHDHDFEPSFPISRSPHRLYQS
jgi:hypothetical protein